MSLSTPPFDSCNRSIWTTSTPRVELYRTGIPNAYTPYVEPTISGTLNTSTSHVNPYECSTMTPSTLCVGTRSSGTEDALIIYVDASQANPTDTSTLHVNTHAMNNMDNSAPVFKLTRSPATSRLSLDVDFDGLQKRRLSDIHAILDLEQSADVVRTEAKIREMLAKDATLAEINQRTVHVDGYDRKEFMYRVHPELDPKNKPSYWHYSPPPSTTYTPPRTSGRRRVFAASTIPLPLLLPTKLKWEDQESVRELMEFWDIKMPKSFHETRRYPYQKKWDDFIPRGVKVPSGYNGGVSQHIGQGKRSKGLIPLLLPQIVRVKYPERFDEPSPLEGSDGTDYQGGFGGTDEEKGFGVTDEEEGFDETDRHDGFDDTAHMAMKYTPREAKQGGRNTNQMESVQYSVHQAKQSVFELNQMALVKYRAPQEIQNLRNVSQMEIIKSPVQQVLPRIPSINQMAMAFLEQQKVQIIINPSQMTMIKYLMQQLTQIYLDSSQMAVVRYQMRNPTQTSHDVSRMTTVEYHNKQLTQRAHDTSQLALAQYPEKQAKKRFIDIEKQLYHADMIECISDEESSQASEDITKEDGEQRGRMEKHMSLYRDFDWSIEGEFLKKGKKHIMRRASRVSVLFDAEQEKPPLAIEPQDLTFRGPLAALGDIVPEALADFSFGVFDPENEAEMGC